MGKKSRRGKAKNVGAAAAGTTPSALEIAQRVARHREMLQDVVGQQHREQVAEDARQRREKPTENDKLMDRICDWKNIKWIEQRQLIRRVMKNSGVNLDSYESDQYGDGDQSPLNDACRYDLERLYYQLFDFALSSEEAYQFYTEVPEEPDMEMLPRITQMLDLNGAKVEEMMQQAKDIKSKIESEQPFSRLACYADRSRAKMAEELILKSSKPGTEERRQLLEKRETTFHLSPLLIAAYSFFMNTQFYPGDDYEGMMHVLLKYGANPFARDITGRTAVHYLTDPSIKKDRTDKALRLAQMCIDASHHYHAKLHKVVTLQELSKVELNGRSGYCGGFDASNGNLLVYLKETDGMYAPTPLSFKAENLVSVSEDASSCPVPLVDIATRFGSTALYMICRIGERDDLARFLVKNRASIDLGGEYDSPRALAENPISQLALSVCSSNTEARATDSVIRQEIARQAKRAAKSTDDAPEERACAACGERKKKISPCAQCRGVSYCNRSCQKLHWNDHKTECMKSKAVALGPPKPEELAFDLVAQSIRLADGVDTAQGSVGGYNAPESVGVNELFWLKVTAYSKSFLLCYDETKSCCFVIFKGGETYDPIFDLIRPGFVEFHEQMRLSSGGPTELDKLSEVRHFRAKFDASGTCMVYPKTMRIKKTF